MIYACCFCVSDIRGKYVLTKKSEAYVLNFPDADSIIALIMLVTYPRTIEMLISIPSEALILYTRDSTKHNEQLLKIQYQLHEKDALCIDFSDDSRFNKTYHPLFSKKYIMQAERPIRWIENFFMLCYL